MMFQQNFKLLVLVVVTISMCCASCVGIGGCSELKNKESVCGSLLKKSSGFSDLPPSALPFWLEQQMAEGFGFDYKKTARCRVSREILQPEDHFAASIYFLCLNDLSRSISLLEEAINRGFRSDQKYVAFFKTALSEWKFENYLRKVLKNKAQHKKKSNKQLSLLYEEDQKDRRSYVENKVLTLKEKDQQRKQRVYKIVKAIKLETEEDYFHAAIILQHGDMSEDYLLAYQLSLEAIKLNPYYDSVRWLAAAALDRYLLSINNPSLFGTQFLVTKNSIQAQETCDTPQELKYYWRVNSISKQQSELQNYITNEKHER